MKLNTIENGTPVRLSWVVLATLAVALVSYLTIKYVRTVLRLRSFKGPYLAVTSKLWMLKCVWNQNLHTQTKAVCDEYGSLARISPWDLVTDDPELVMRMSAVRSPYSKSDFYMGTKFDVGCNHIFSETDETRHTSLRNRLAAGYTGRENPYLELSVDGLTKDLIQLIDRKYLSTDKVFRKANFAKIAQFFTLDVISEVAFGKALGFLQRDEDINGYCRVAERAVPKFEWAAALPSLNKFVRLPLVRDYVMPKPTDKTGVGMLMAFGQKQVAERYSEKEFVKPDMLGSFLKHGLSRRQAETESTFQMMAGSDTTVTALRTTALLIMTNPVVYRKVQEELDNAQSAGKLDLPVATDPQCLELSYLHACIHETMRVWAPAFVLAQKITPPEGDWYNGKFIPGGTRIGTSTYGLMRNKKVWGEDAELFRPERWLEERDEERLQRMVRTLDLVFGWGRYQCLGKPLAMLELRKTLSTLFYRYDMAIFDAGQPMKAFAANGLWMQSDMFIRITPRPGKWEPCQAE